MNKQQIIELLHVYRPGIDDNDEQFAAALAQARQDPELARILAEQTAADRAIRAKLTSIKPPADLKHRILAEHTIVRVPLTWWRQPQWLAAAAAIVILAGFAFFSHRATPPNSFVAFRNEMARFVSAKYELDTHEEEFDKVRAAFAAKHWPAEYVVPAGLKNIALEGGCLLNWHANKVSLLCLETKGDGDVWLFVIDRAAASNTPTTPTLQRIGKIMTASWSDGAYTYILATDGTVTPIQQYF